MSFEVELKFRLETNHSVEDSLRQMHAVEQALVLHVDHYFNHPSRDFRTTDEAFRIRSVNSANFITYKGPVIGNVAKTRQEIEIAVAPGTDAVLQLFELVRCLGFRFVREVRKFRRCFTLDWNQRHYELALDDVPELGCFLEIERIANDDDREDAERAVWRLANSLGLSTAERRSYLDMLLEYDQDSGPLNLAKL